MSLSYASEKLGEAVQALATGLGDVRSRVRAASGPLALVDAAALPDDLRAEYDAIWKAMTKRPSTQKGQPWDTGDIAETTSRMRNTTAQKIARRICSLDAKVSSLLDT